MTRAARVITATLAALGAASVAALTWGALVERRRWTVRHEELRLLPPGASPLTILHLSDLHLAPWQRDKIAFVRSLAAFEPDLIVNTGDNMGHVDALPALAHAFAPFRGVPGVFVHGSNDFAGPVVKNPFRYLSGPSRASREGEDLNVGAMERLFSERLGWWDLNNRVRAVELRGTALELLGIGDAHHRHDRLTRLPAQVEQLREAVEWSRAAALPPVTVGITHAPYRRVLDAFVTEGTQLIMAGHTHGGQVRIPGLPALVANCDLPREQAQGVSLWRHGAGASVLEVSAGLGTSIYAPVRFACPPEAVILTLTPATF